jgi:hypothetical protein
MKTSDIFARLSTIALIAGTAVFSNPAIAAAEGNHDWTGAYVGANVGAGMSSGNIDDPDCFDCSSAAFNERLLQAGFNGGYNKQFGATVLGAEAEIGAVPFVVEN